MYAVMELTHTLDDMPSAYKYEYTQRRLLHNMVYYTDTMGTLRGKCTIDQFSGVVWKKG